MSEVRSDAPITLRAAAKLAGCSARSLKRRLRAYERSGVALMFRHLPRGRLYTTLALCRSAFGEDFGRDLTPGEVELARLRRDVNALGARLATISRMLVTACEKKSTTIDQHRPCAAPVSIGGERRAAR